MIQHVGNLISGSSAFSKSNLNIWKFSVHVPLKPSLEDFEHYFVSVWDECNCAVVWAFFGSAFLWDWNENWPFPVLWPLLSFPNLLAYWVQHFHSIIFQDWNSSTGIPSPTLALFVAMLPKAHLTSHSRLSGSRWIEPRYLMFDIMVIPTRFTAWLIALLSYTSPFTTRRLWSMMGIYRLGANKSKSQDAEKMGIKEILCLLWSGPIKCFPWWNICLLFHRSAGKKTKPKAFRLISPFGRTQVNL